MGSSPVVLRPLRHPAAAAHASRCPWSQLPAPTFHQLRSAIQLCNRSWRRRVRRRWMRRRPASRVWWPLAISGHRARTPGHRKSSSHQSGGGGLSRTWRTIGGGRCLPLCTAGSRPFRRRRRGVRTIHRPAPTRFRPSPPPNLSRPTQPLYPPLHPPSRCAPSPPSPRRARLDGRRRGRRAVMQRTSATLVPTPPAPA